ncbi:MULTISPECIES: glycosyltransferase family 4 protein [Cyanophyceae]|uniref:glycosyltransferase family 4 protein n=1 Tax=Cyanophyceae TaxID=3028117 RepID=UPI0016828EC3|nr:glycosyltransferase family 4 protein [Trichocoleus sp. FACHB-40]MBD2002386.1 glycosyltransferase family 4 protein [Trichocoleus sp. FACHB-40]
MSRLQAIKSLIPYNIRLKLYNLRQQWQDPWRLWNILLAGVPDRNQAYVYYGHDNIPQPGELARGGIVKFQGLQKILPNSPRRFNILYMVSSRMPEDGVQLVWLARQKKAKFVWNQNGVAYPAWHGIGWEETNKPFAKLLHSADYVFYQSKFCKESADKFLGKREGKWEILYNAVDTKVFTPADCDPNPKHLVLLLGGTQSHYYRVESAIRTLAILSHQRSDVRLLITGKLRWTDETEAMRMTQQLVTDLGVSDRVEFLGAYTQKDAPAIFRKAHILLHTQYNDACPGMVVEAIACGLPVVYSHSGGVPELVGEEAGIGVPTELSWEREIPPDPNALAEAVLQVAEQRAQYAQAARQRAVEKFDLRPWLVRHQEVFQELLSR